MSHFLNFSAVFLLIALLFFAFFSLDISFDDGFSYEARVCQTHGRLRIFVTLPQAVAESGETAGALLRALPTQLVTPVAFVGESVFGLFSLLHEALLSEAEGCVAFSH